MDLGLYSILFSAAALLVLAILLLGKARARQRRREEGVGPLPVFFKLEPETRQHSGNGQRSNGASRSSVLADRFARPDESHVRTPAAHAAVAGGGSVAPPARAARREQPPDEKTVVFKRHTDGPLQLLPGRLEVVDGEGEGRDIRFMRAWGEAPEVTFGRTRGPAHRHVQLVAPTVSRNHARMELEGERWKITNLSATNPVVINGEELPAQTTRFLDEGDRIEMGEVIFRYRER
jgi:hypothetical protein